MKNGADEIDMVIKHRLGQRQKVWVEAEEEIRTLKKDAEQKF